MRSIFFCLFFYLFVHVTYAQAEMTMIKAHVNRQIITSLDITHRQEILKKLGYYYKNKNKILRMLISENILLQLILQDQGENIKNKVLQLYSHIFLHSGFKIFPIVTQGIQDKYSALEGLLMSHFIINKMIKNYISLHINMNKSELFTKSKVQNCYFMTSNSNAILLPLVLSKNHDNLYHQIVDIKQALNQNIPFCIIVKQYSYLQNLWSKSFDYYQVQSNIKNLLIGLKLKQVIGPVEVNNNIVFFQLVSQKHIELNKQQLVQLLLNHKVLTYMRALIDKYGAYFYIIID